MRTYLSTHHRHSKPSTFAPLDSLLDKFSSFHTFIPENSSMRRSRAQVRLPRAIVLTMTNFPPPHFSNNARTHLHQKDGVGSILVSPCCRCYFGGCFTLHGKRGFHETKFSYWWWYRYLCCDGPPNFARFDAGATSLCTWLPSPISPGPLLALSYGLCVMMTARVMYVGVYVHVWFIHIYLVYVCVCVCVCMWCVMISTDFICGHKTRLRKNKNSVHETYRTVSWKLRLLCPFRWVRPIGAIGS